MLYPVDEEGLLSYEKLLDLLHSADRISARNHRHLPALHDERSRFHSPSVRTKHQWRLE